MLHTPLLSRKVTIHSRKVNTPHISRVTATAEAGGVCTQPAPTVHFMKANHHQKRPYEVKATMPKVLPVLNSNTPAISWAMPPYAKARGTTAATAAGGQMPALKQLRTTVVRPKPANPSGSGLAALNAGGVKATSFSIVLDSSCSSVSVAHPSYLPIGEIDTGKRTYSRNIAWIISDSAPAGPRSPKRLILLLLLCPDLFFRVFRPKNAWQVPKPSKSHKQNEIELAF